MNRAAHLLLTATVDPGSTGALRHRDPAARLREYESAFRECLVRPGPSRIIFCENSGHGLEGIRRMAEGENRRGKTARILSFAGNGEAAKRGKGAGELRILEHVLGEGSLGPDDLVIKLTGRLRVTNLPEVCRRIEERAGLAPDATHPHDAAPDVMCDFRGNLRWADSRLFACTVPFLREHLLALGDLLDESAGITFEHVLARAVHRAMAGGMNWSLLPGTPRFAGISATTGERYPDSWIGQWRREAFRRLKAGVLIR